MAMVSLDMGIFQFVAAELAGEGDDGSDGVVVDEIGH
jgi:hypothetical protein